MKELIFAFSLALSASAADLSAVPPVMDCAQLKSLDLSAVADTPIHITDSVKMEDGKPAPYCKITGYVEPHVQFEVRLPLAGWTQRFLETGCGGLCGHTDVHVSNAGSCVSAQRGELALAGTDMGHEGPGGDFGDDPQLRIDFAYRGVHVTALTAKALIAKYYGQAAKYSYFAGCSDGGREALMEAQRFPNDFDGITAGAPAMNFITQNSFYHGWNARVNTDAAGQAILTSNQLPILHAAAVAACGGKDGLIADPRTCHFDPAVTQCKAGDDPKTCLTAEQVAAARKIYQGAHDEQGHKFVISGPQVGSELAWRGVYIPNRPEQRVMSAQISTDTIKHLLYDKPLPASYTLADFRFDTDTFAGIKQMHSLYDATNPDLTAFAAHGGKLILWHGWSDPHISPLNTIAYYSAVKQFMGVEKAKQFARLYLFPGGYHCGGGEGPFDVDLLSPIMAWVENQSAPNELTAKNAKMTSSIAPYSFDLQPRDQPDWLGAEFYRVPVAAGASPKFKKVNE